MLRFKTIALAGALLTGAWSLATTPSLAQSMFTPDKTMTNGPEADNVKDQINSYNALINSGKTYQPISPDDQVIQMGLGMNFMAGYDSWWEGGETKIKPYHFAKIKAAGFDTIRVPLFAFKHLQADGHLDAEYLKRIDWVIGQAMKNNLTVILDEHNFEECAKDSDSCANNLANVWYELSAHYKDAPNTVVFELLNEPNGQVDDKLWNSWLIDLLAIVRETNPTRNVIIGPTHWNSRADLHLLALPKTDQHIIVTFHYYDPFPFTHQGASWAPKDIEALNNVRWQGTQAERDAIKTDFDTVLKWSLLAKRPVFLGEYGAYDKYGKMEDRAAWTAAVTQEARAHGFATGYWYFDGGFGAYDLDKDKWIEPIKTALTQKAK